MVAEIMKTPKSVVDRAQSATQCGVIQQRYGLQWHAGLEAEQLATYSPIASDDVSPGDSIPNRLTRYGMPWSCGPWTTKSAAASSGPVIFGRMPA